MKKRHRKTIWAGALLFPLMGAGLIAGQQGDPSARPEIDVRVPSLLVPNEVAEAIKRNCGACHFKGGSAVGYIRLDELSASVERSERGEEEWRRVYARAITEKTMPPGAGKLPDDDRCILREWIDSVFPENAPPPVAARTLRRLTIYEYNRTIRDIFGFDFDLAGFFQEDPANEGFDNNAAVMFWSEGRVQQYLAASQYVSETVLGVNGGIAFKENRWMAEDIRKANARPGLLDRLGRWIGDRMNHVPKGQRPEKPPKLRIQTAADSLGKTVKALDLEEGARFTLRHDFPVSGEYRFALSASSRESKIPAKVRLSIDGVALPLTIELTPFQKSLKSHSLTVHVPRGKRALSVVGASREHVLLSSLEIAGPILPGVAGKDQKLALASSLPCVQPPPTGDAEDCAARSIQALASKAFRAGPVGDSDVQTMLNPFRVAIRDGKDFRAALSYSVQRVLMDPRFLVRLEKPAPLRRVDDFEFATRLSYFLWGSLPDDELRTLASSGALAGSPETIRGQVARMIKDPRADALVDAFAGGWFGFNSIDGHVVDTNVYANFSEELRLAMKAETRAFLFDFFGNNRPVGDLIGSKTLFMNEVLARHYEIPNVTGSEIRPIESFTRQRVGLLTQGAFLTLTSSSYRTSVVKRGFWILDKVLCETVPDPGPIPEPPKTGPGMSQRKIMESHRAQEPCASCHNRMDPLGFSLENYDGAGAWRTMDNEAAIDASGEFAGTEGSIPFADFAELRDMLKSDPRIPACATRKLLTYALGRSLTEADHPAIQAIGARAQPGGYKILDLITETVLSDPFRNR